MPLNSADRTSPTAASHRRRTSPSAYSRALSIAIPAAPARATSTALSSAVNWPPPRFSVMYRLPKTAPRTSTGTPRNERIGGGGGGETHQGRGGGRKGGRGGVGPR